MTEWYRIPESPIYGESWRRGSHFGQRWHTVCTGAWRPEERSLYLQHPGSHEGEQRHDGIAVKEQGGPAGNGADRRHAKAHKPQRDDK